MRNTELSVETHHYQVSESSLLWCASHKCMCELPVLLAFLVKRITLVEHKKLISCMLTKNRNAHGGTKDRWQHSKDEGAELLEMHLTHKWKGSSEPVFLLWSLQDVTD